MPEGTCCDMAHQGAGARGARGKRGGGGRGLLAAAVLAAGALRVGAARAAGGAGGALPPGMVAMRGGFFQAGADGFYPEEAPVRRAEVGPFAIDAAAVTNAEFGAFAGGVPPRYTTDAEHFGDSFAPYWLVPKSMAAAVERAVADAQWWLPVPGASWHSPEGPGSDLRGREDHPAVHVSHRDASAFCAWAGKRLPSSDEWEYAARGGLEGAAYPWGRSEDGLSSRANTFEGIFPEPDAEPADGCRATCPSRSFPPNAFGLYNMVGNVWEWVATEAPAPSGRVAQEGGAGPPPFFLRGGSYMCHRSYCHRYRVSALTAATADSSASHYGFRCALSLGGPGAPPGAVFAEDSPGVGAQGLGAEEGEL